MKSLWGISFKFQISFLLFLGTAPLLSAQDASKTNVNGTPAVAVTLPPNRGGTIIPLPRAIFGRQGTLAIKIAATGFASNGILLDLGGESTSRIMIQESWGGGPSPARTGHFRLLVSDGHGNKPPLDGPQARAIKPYLLVVAWKDGEYEFWIDGTSVGKLENGPILDKAPARLALVEPIGLRWQQIEVWSKQLGYAEVQNRTASDHWTFTADTTLHAIRAEGHEASQIISIGPGILHADDVLAALNKPLARRTLFVDATTGNDQLAGDVEHPFKTIAHAATVAGAGDTVVVMPGTYRESVKLDRSGRPDAPITFRASPTGPVTLQGTDPLSGLTAAETTGHVSLWVKSGFKSRDVRFGDPKTIETLKGRGASGAAQLERRGRVDTIWLDGQFVTKAVDRESLRPRTFWVDAEKGELILALSPGDRPERHLLEVGARGPFFTGDVSYIHLQGFRGDRPDTPYFVGAITPGVSSSNWFIEDFVESWGNWAGILLHGFGHVVMNSVTNNNGDDGIEGTLCEFITLEGNTSNANDWQPERYINPSWGSGGSKFTQTDHMIVRNHEAAFNHGPGFWFDENNVGITIENSYFHHNNVGIMAEISPGPFLFRDNICFANEGAGILIAESTRAAVERNTLVANKNGIEIRNITGRKGAGLAEGQVSFEAGNILLTGNILAENTTAGIANTFAGIDPARNHVMSDGNLFFKNSAMVLWPSKQSSGSTVKIDASNDWTPSEDGSGGLRMLTLDVVRRALGLEKTSVSADPHFVMTEASDYGIDRTKVPADLPYGPSPTVPADASTFLP